MKYFLLSLKYWAGLLLIPVSLVLFCAVCHAKGVSRAEVDRIFKAIKNIAQETVQSGNDIPNFVAAPDIKIDRQRKELHYGRGRTGSLRSTEDLGFKKDEPWDLPLAMQIQIDLLTEIFDKLPGGKAIWAPYRERGEFIVKETIESLLSPPDELDWRINHRKREFAMFIGETVLPFDQVARKNGLKAVLDEGYGAGEDMLKVEVLTEPPGGSVKVIPLLAYKVYQSLGRSSDLWPWKSLVRNTEMLLGKYKYAGTWPDGGLKEGEIELKYKENADDKPEKITFKR